MVVVVADPILVAGRRSGGLNTPDEAFGDQDAEGVVYRLERDRADLDPDERAHFVGRDVRATGHSAQDSQSLRRDLNAALTEKFCRVGRQASRIDQSFD